MALRTYFGFDPVQNFIACWGARAIFKPLSSRPLDLLWDRQGVRLAVDDDEHRSLAQQMAMHLNDKGILDDLNDLTGKWFDVNDIDVFVKHYPWGQGDTEFILVATGSPNGSYGYFYLSVSLVKKTDAPEEKKPLAQVLDEERAARQKQLEQEEAEARERRKPIEKQRRQAVKDKRAAIEDKVANATHKEEGERLEVGDHFYVEVNQGDRDAFVLAIDGEEAFAKYCMPKGREFLVVVDRDDHCKIKNISPNRVPKKWQKADLKSA